MQAKCGTGAAMWLALMAIVYNTPDVLYFFSLRRYQVVSLETHLGLAHPQLCAQCLNSEMQCINANRPQPDDIQTAQTNATAYVSSRDVKETLGYETETFGFQSMTRLRPFHYSTRPRPRF